MTKPTGNRPGRPTLMTPDLVDRICERLAEGENLKDICQAEDMPHQRTVLRWAEQDKAFRDRYSLALALRTDVWAEEIIHIADNATFATIKTDQLRIAARQWAMGKANPTKYGDKATVEHRHSLSDLSDAELERELQANLAKIGVKLLPKPEA